MSDETDLLFARSEPSVPATYAALMSAVRQFGDIIEEPKKTSIHLVAGSGFAGVHPKRAKLRLNIRTAGAIASPRVRKTEQVSANRFHNEVDLAGPSDVDAELVGWLRQAFDLGAPKGGA